MTSRLFLRLSVSNHSRVIAAALIVLLLALLLRLIASASITLDYFRGSPETNDILLEWQTATELTTAGFYIMRWNDLQSKYEEYSEFIPAQGSGTTGATYDWPDQQVTLGVTYYYMLEEVERNQAKLVYGPVTVTMETGSYSGYTCTQTYTSTADAIGGQTGNDFSTVAILSTYYDLSLVGTQPQNATAPAFDEYFRLDNATIGGTYKVEAIPQRTDNYNLGLFVYDHNFTPIYTDTDTSNSSFKASVMFVANNYGPYYFRVSQITPICHGGTYDLTYGLARRVYLPIVLRSP
jgi:hypothetical protein